MRLPREGKTPGQSVAQVPKVAPKESTMTIGQYAIVRNLKNSAGGFKQYCKSEGKWAPYTKYTLQEWNELFKEYWNQPVRG